MDTLHGSLRTEDCGIRLIYAEKYEQKYPTLAQGSTSYGNFGEHGSETGDTNSKAYNKRKPMEQNPLEVLQNTRFTNKL